MASVQDEPAPSLRPPDAVMALSEGAAPADVFDVAVIGGGVNGTGVARDLSLRGLRVVLFERHDLAFGASGNSSGMIHGGVRYLSQSPHVTESSCRDSGYIQRIAPHLLFRMPFLMPIKAGLKGRIAIELIDAYFRAYDDYQPLKRGEPHCRLDARDAIEHGASVYTHTTVERVAKNPAAPEGGRYVVEGRDTLTQQRVRAG